MLLLLREQQELQYDIDNRKSDSNINKFLKKPEKQVLIGTLIFLNKLQWSRSCDIKYQYNKFDIPAEHIDIDARMVNITITTEKIVQDMYKSNHE